MITPENSNRPSAAFTSCSCSSSARLRVGGALQPAQLHSSSNLHSDTSFSLHSLQTTRSTFCTQQVIKNNWEQHSGCPMFVGPHTASKWGWKVLNFTSDIRDYVMSQYPKGLTGSTGYSRPPSAFGERSDGRLAASESLMYGRSTSSAGMLFIYSPTHILSPFKMKIHSPLHSGKSLFQNYWCEFWKKIVKKQTNK